MWQIVILTLSFFTLVACDYSVSESGQDEKYAALADSEAKILTCRKDLLQGVNIAGAHYQLGKLFQGSSSDNLLAIWHYRQFLTTCPAADARMEEVRILLEHAEKKYYQLLQERYDSAANTDLNLKVKLLQTNNQQMKQWVTRLDRENFALRELLLTQKQPATQTPASVATPKLPANLTSATNKPARKNITHLIVAGDTLGKIAQKYYASSDPAKIRLLQDANPSLKDPNQLRIGSSIVIPVE